MITLNNNNYIKSQNIRVFPCAYRGYYNTATGETLVFDPEARATTEANFTNTFHRLSAKKDSYVIAWVPDAEGQKGTLKCVIGGYYFEIYNHSIEDFFYDNGGKKTSYYLCIQTTPIDLGTSESDESDARTTRVLSSFVDTTNYLDTKEGNDYIFTGLLVSKNDSGTASLIPFIAVPNDTEGSYDYKVDPAKLPITNLLDVGSGNYSVRMIEGDTEQGTNTTEASGDYSVALGKGTKATGEASAALGNNTEASAKGAFAAGNNAIASGEGAIALGSDTTASGTNAVALGNTTTASGENSVALGSNTKAETANQVVIGRYNELDANQAFIIANGGGTGNRSNKFTVSYKGDVKALGTLETMGSIKATGATSNDLILGTEDNESYGSISVYGESDSKVFETTKEGITTIAGATSITDATASNNTATGALTVTGGVGIGESLNVGGNANLGDKLVVKTAPEGDETAVKVDGSLNITGQTKLEETLEVGGATTLASTLKITGSTTLSNNLIVTGNTTIAAAEANDGKSATNILTIGNNTKNISGALNIYGPSNAKVFSVANNGTTRIAGKATSAATIADDDDATLTTKGYVDTATSEAESRVNRKINTLVEDTTVSAGTQGTGSYVQSIKQEDGIITATKMSFAGEVKSDETSNAPTSSAVASCVNTAVSGVWTKNVVKKTEGGSISYSLQAIILDAVYPVGSIYMSTRAESNNSCPLVAAWPDSEWERIENGRFLISAGAPYWGGKTIIAGEMAGSPDAVLIKHNHNYSDKATTTKEGGGEHSHKVRFYATDWGTGDFTGFDGRKSEPGDNTKQVEAETTVYSDTHTHELPTIDTNGDTDGKGANLPPYLAVYMWKRTK